MKTIIIILVMLVATSLADADIPGVGAIDSSVTTGEFITANLWNTNFGNINTWISAITGQKAIDTVDIALEAVTTAEIADDAVQERIVLTNTTGDDTITEDSFANRTALKIGAADTTSYNITLEAGEVLFIFCTVRLFYDGSYTAGVDGSSSNYVTISVNRTGTDLNIRATVIWEPDNAPVVQTITFMEYDALGAGSYTYSIMAHSNVVHASGDIVKSNIETLFMIDKGK